MPACAHHVASRPGTHNLRCLFRVAFVPSDPCDLAQKDLAAFEYFYLQCCNDVVQERYAPELKYDVALRLAALHIHQHCLANNIQPSKITVKSVERDFGLERFVPSSLLETMKRKELRKVLTHLLKLNYTMTGTSHKCLTALQAKLYYLTIISQLPSYGAKCFPTNSMDSTVENVILVSPKLGISQITGLRNNIPIPVAEIEQLSMVSLEKEDHLLSTVTLYLPSTPNKELRLTVEERDAEELVLVLQGYYKLFTNNDLHVHQDPDEWLVDTGKFSYMFFFTTPLYHSQHIVKPAYWSYGGDGESEELRMVNFAIPLHTLNPNKQMKMNGTNTLSRSNSKVIRSNGVDSNMNVPGKVRDRNGMKPLSPSNNGMTSTVSCLWKY
uniref:FERM domain-containing protein n=1 Tax=Rhodnius prolixus TaxID=13249 RepID=T1I9V3_RHOPR